MQNFLLLLLASSLIHSCSSSEKINVVRQPQAETSQITLDGNVVDSGSRRELLERAAKDYNTLLETFSSPSLTQINERTVLNISDYKRKNSEMSNYVSAALKKALNTCSYGQTVVSVSESTISTKSSAAYSWLNKFEQTRMPEYRDPEFNESINNAKYAFACLKLMTEILLK